jgi:hypothetical protein
MKPEHIEDTLKIFYESVQSVEQARALYRWLQRGIAMAQFVCEFGQTSQDQGAADLYIRQTAFIAGKLREFCKAKGVEL